MNSVSLRFVLPVILLLSGCGPPKIEGAAANNDLATELRGDIPRPSTLIRKIRIYKTPEARFIGAEELKRLPFQTIQSAAEIERFFDIMSEGRRRGRKIRGSPNDSIKSHENYCIVFISRDGRYGTLQFDVRIHPREGVIAWVQASDGTGSAFLDAYTPSAIRAKMFKQEP